MDTRIRTIRRGWFGASGAALIVALLLAPRAGSAADTDEPTDAVCAVGTFETPPDPGGFTVVFTNRSPRACLSVPYYCLWGMTGSTGFYRQSTHATFNGRIGPGETVTIATIEPYGGPADRQVAWSWCVVRPEPPAGTGEEAR